MATIQTYSFQEDGVVIIGGVTLDNVTNSSLKWEGGRETSERLSAGDTQALTVYGTKSMYTCTLELELYDRNGVDAELNQFLMGTASGEAQAITLRPFGTAAGKKERILDTPDVDPIGMELTSKDVSYSTGKDLPAVSGKMTWTGLFYSEVPETLQT